MTNNNNDGLHGMIAWPTQFFLRNWEMHQARSQQILSVVKFMQSRQSNRIESGVAIGAKSASGLFEGNFDLFSQRDSSIQDLVSFIRQTLALAISIANGQETSPERIAIDFTESWYHIANDGGFHDAHFHQGCSWCGIYYLQVGSSGNRVGRSAPNGGSRFYSPIHSGGSHVDYGNKYLTPSIDMPVEDGLLLLFPSYLLHSGLPYQGNTDRIVIAFNACAFLRQ